MTRSVAVAFAPVQFGYVGKKGSRPDADTPMQAVLRAYLRKKIEQAPGTRKEIAAALGCTTQNLDYIASGAPGRYVNLNHLEQLASHNRITLAALFGELAGMAPYVEAKLTPEKPSTTEPVQAREPVFHVERKRELEDLEQQQETAAVAHDQPASAPQVSPPRRQRKKPL